MLKIIIVSFSLTKGGASIAAYRFKQILKKLSNTTVESINQDNAGIIQLFKRIISLFLCKLQFDKNPIKHSLNLFSYKPVIESFKHNQNSLHHLHWINNETLSIFDFDKIPSGSIISLHDEWLYCGTEHLYNIFDCSKDFSFGYKYFKKGVLGVHWNALIWKIKYKRIAHRNDLIYTVPSNWMLERAQSSLMLRKSNIRLLPNPVDTDIFKPSSKKRVASFRNYLSIDDDCFVIVFPTIKGQKNNLKGIELLYNAIKLLHQKSMGKDISKIILVNFGGSKGENKLFGFRNISIGHIYDTSFIANLYSSADCIIVPSLIESFGQVATEAISCGTPVISFDTSGLRDIVLDRYNGLVAKSLSASSLSNQIITMINSSKESRIEMGKNGRQHILENFSYPIITEKYLNILKEAATLKKN